MLDLDQVDNKHKALGIAVAVLFAGLVGMDMVVLKGEHVDSDRLSLSREQPAEIEIARVGETHLVEISSRRYRSGGKSKGRALEYRLEDPDGIVVYENSEIASRKRRFFDFVPLEEGTYKLYAETNMELGGRGSADVRVYVNDRRILARLMNW